LRLTANPWRVRAALVFTFVAAMAAPALATDPVTPAKPAAAEAAAQTPVSPATQAVLDRVAKGETAAVDELYALAPTAIAELDTFLKRTHTAPVEDRRGVLASFEA